MRKTLILAAFAGALTTAMPAFASDDDGGVSSDIPRDQWLSIAAITQKFAAAGYDVRSVEPHDGAYEIYALDKDGKRIEAYVHPLTGEILKQEQDD